ncbi:MAG: hypothetical protein R6V57_13415 [Vicinamibacterales bacterium]
MPLVQAAAKLRQGRRVHVQDLVEDLRRADAVERAPAGQALEQHGAEGEQVAAAVDRTLLHLLGRHVRRRALARRRLAGFRLEAVHDPGPSGLQ